MIALLVGSAVGLVVTSVGARAPTPRVPGRARVPARSFAPSEVVAAAVRLLERAKPARRWARRDEQLPDGLDRLAAALRAGHAVGPALVELSRTLPDPLGQELRMVTASITHGASVASALDRWAAQPGASADVRLVAAALTLGADAGGEVARAVDRIAATLRERRELQGEVRALATQAHTSAGVLAVAPLAFAGVVATIEPAVVAFLVTTPVGLACLGLGLALEALGAIWMSRITRGVA